MTITSVKNEMAFDIAAIRDVLTTTPLAPINSLPPVWQALNKDRGNTLLSDTARYLYVEAAALFLHHATPMAAQALTVIANDFHHDAYPDLDRFHDDTLKGRVYAALRDLYRLFGYDVPAAFYNVLIGTLEEEDAMDGKGLFRKKEYLMRDRLWDSVLHAVLLVTPIGMTMQSILSQHGVMIIHLMNCNCKIKDWPHKPMEAPLEDTLKTFYLQNVVAAAFEQYGVNAATSGKKRGF